jgi:hypothetical protein
LEVEDGIRKAKELLKENVNPELMRRALGIYLIHSRDAQRRKIVVPPLMSHVSFLSNRSIPPQTVSTTAGPKVVAGEVVTADTFQGPALLSYWREDYDLNDFHYYWHMMFPGTTVNVGGENIKLVDRPGEHFMQIVSQMVARYETEGLCWNLPLVRPWNQYDDILEHGYVPVPGLIEYYGGYPPFSSWYSVRNPDIPDLPQVDVSRKQMETWRDNIYEAIKNGYFWGKKQGTNAERTPLPLTPDNCMDLVGSVVDAEYLTLPPSSDGLSVDGDLYGNLHNYGHGNFAEISYQNYPTKAAQYGLMISNFGALRDPCFWPWHKHIQYFRRLASAKFPQDITAHRAHVRLSSLVVCPQKKSTSLSREEGITAFLGPPALNLLESKAKIGHEPYQWSVDIQSTRSSPPSEDSPQALTLRLFIAARDLVNDYHSWIEMDRVIVHLTSESTLTKVRLDTDSSIARKMGSYSELDPKSTSPWDRCRWPQHMMLPVGKVEGMPFVAFCMATDDTTAPRTRVPNSNTFEAIQTDQMLSDPLGMGYPFNRAWVQDVMDNAGKASIRQVISDAQTYPFMATTTFKIFRATKLFQDSILNPCIPPASVTWFNTIKDYFLESDKTCMLYAYGYDLGNYDHVRLHSGAILDATSSKRMPLQMSPWSQENPDPNHPLWTPEMCDTFRAWMLNGCPKGTEST